MSKHKCINYFITFISLAIVFYYFSISFSKTLKDQKEILETSCHVENKSGGIPNKIKKIENKISKWYSLRKDSTQLGGCETGIKQAMKNAGNKIYKLYTFGAIMLPMAEESKFNRFYENLLKSNYGISTEHLGCIVSPGTECYSIKMEDLIKIEFGAEIFDQTREKAIILFKNEIKTK